MIKNSFWKTPLVLAVFALAFALAGCGGTNSPAAGPSQVIITVTNLSGDWWDGMELFLTLETGTHSNWVIHAKGVATVQNEQAVFRMYTADAGGNITAQRFATAGSFYLTIHNDECCLTGTNDMVPITTGSQSMPLGTHTGPDAPWWGC